MCYLPELAGTHGLIPLMINSLTTLDLDERAGFSFGRCPSANNLRLEWTDWKGPPGMCNTEEDHRRSAKEISIWDPRSLMPKVGRSWRASDDPSRHFCWRIDSGWAREVCQLRSSSGILRVSYDASTQKTWHTLTLCVSIRYTGFVYRCLLGKISLCRAR